MPPETVSVYLCTKYTQGDDVSERNKERKDESGKRRKGVTKGKSK